MAATFGSLADETLGHLRGFVRDQELSTYLTGGIGAADLSFVVADGSVVSRGRVEIGSEILYVDRVDRTTGAVHLPPYGRGMDSSTAATHASGDRVVVAPLFPRRRVLDAVNDVVQGMGLPAVATTTFTYSGAQVAYGLPAAVDDVLAISAEVDGPSGVWAPVRRWRLDKGANTGEFATGTSVDVYDALRPGTTVQVVYSKDPTLMAAESDGFAATTGLPESARDVVVLGAASRMLLLSDAWDASTRAVDATTLAVAQQLRSDGGAMSKYLFQLHRTRLEEERARIQGKYPARVHYER